MALRELPTCGNRLTRRRQIGNRGVGPAAGDPAQSRGPPRTPTDPHLDKSTLPKRPPLYPGNQNNPTPPPPSSPLSWHTDKQRFSGFLAYEEKAEVHKRGFVSVSHHVGLSLSTLFQHVISAAASRQRLAGHAGQRTFQTANLFPSALPPLSKPGRTHGRAPTLTPHLHLHPRDQDQDDINPKDNP